jgi:hypothetical protein
VTVRLSALTERRRLRLATLVAAPAFLAERDVGPAAVGAYLGLMPLLFTLKVVAGPGMDRSTVVSMGRGGRGCWPSSCC